MGAQRVGVGPHEEVVAGRERVRRVADAVAICVEVLEVRHARGQRHAGDESGHVDHTVLEVAAVGAVVHLEADRAVKELRTEVDQNRFEQELIYYLEKYDITEEKVRLRNHIDYFLESLHSEDSNGKKLGFICQEMGREINTIGSKANDADIAHAVIGMKGELEKYREQVENIE